MSGIVGIINLDGAPVDRDLLTRMTGFMSYRGPDSQEIWIGDNVGFGHTMLRTTFEAETETQPLTLDGRVWLAADARIDGRHELIAGLEATLRRRLRMDGSGNGSGPARQPNDAELILLAYEAWGEDCVKHLIGDFAFAIWDERLQRLFCARDHFGVKPFYYFHGGDRFAFASEVKALLQVPGIEAELDPQSLHQYLTFLWVPDPKTMFRRILKLPAGHYAILRDGELKNARQRNPYQPQ